MSLSLLIDDLRDVYMAWLEFCKLSMSKGGAGAPIAPPLATPLHSIHLGLPLFCSSATWGSVLPRAYKQIIRTHQDIVEQ